MHFESPLFWIPIASSLIYLAVGSLMKKFPPAEINGLVGYRTSRSMRNQDSWDFAQIEGGKQMIRFGQIGILVGLIGLFIPLIGKWNFYLGIGWIFISCSFLIYSTERSLIRKFGK